MTKTEGYKPSPSEISEAEASMSDEQRDSTVARVEEGAASEYLKEVEKKLSDVEGKMVELAHTLGGLELQRQNIEAGKLSALTPGQQKEELKKISEEIEGLVKKAGDLESDWDFYESELDPTHQAIKKVRREVDRERKIERREAEKEKRNESPDDEEEDYNGAGVLSPDDYAGR